MLLCGESHDLHAYTPSPSLVAHDIDLDPDRYDTNAKPGGGGTCPGWRMSGHVDMRRRRATVVTASVSSFTATIDAITCTAALLCHYPPCTVQTSP